MKFCLRSRLSSKYLTKPDVAEIRVDFRDAESIPDVYHKFKKTIILFPPFANEEYDWKKITQYSTLCEGNLIVSCLTLNDAMFAKNANIRFMLAMEARTGWDLKGMEELGAEYAYVGMPLFFNIAANRRNCPNIKLRAIPTVAYNHHMPYANPVCGQWIRPEDVEKYENLIDIMEFEFCEVPREETLFKVYAIDKEWRTRLDILVDDIGSDALNRLIDPKLIEARLTCNQRCMNGGICHLCDTVLHMAEEQTIQKIKPIIEKSKK